MTIWSSWSGLVTAMKLRRDRLHRRSAELRWSQNTSIGFTDRLARAGAQPSVGSVGDALDNALAETEEVYYRHHHAALAAVPTSQPSGHAGPSQAADDSAVRDA